MSDLVIFYQTQLNHYTTLLNQYKSKSARLSYLRLGCFLLIALTVYCLFNNNFASYLLVMAIAFLIIFLLLIKLHAKVQEQKDNAEILVKINQEELNSLQGKGTIWDNGERFFEPTSYLLDLDIFGSGSLYHLLNRTGTSIGATALANALKTPMLNTNNIKEQQEAIKDITPNSTFRQHILAAGVSEQKNSTDIGKVNSWLKNNQKISAKWWTIAIIAAPIITVAGIIIMIITGNHFLFTAAFLVNLSITGAYLKNSNKLHNELSGAGKILQKYADIFNIVNTNSFESKKLKDIQTNTQDAAIELKHLAALINSFDQRLNFLVAIFFNGLFLYDLRCILSLEKWKTKNTSKVSLWFKEVETIESLNSFATFAFNNPDCVYPAFSSNGNIFSAKNLAHPLMGVGKRIANPVGFADTSRVILITGSNMSGKSTYLRTLGVNMVLASCGAPVCASEFSFTPVKIYTSLRQSDSLQEDTSYFYAELKKLSEIIHLLESGEQALVLLDEVLKGTNSDDKTYGSGELIKRLQYFNALTLIATHDISLGEMEKESGGRIENFCFESTIVNNELLFDYKLHRGVAVNKNATFLMKKMGIIS